MVADFEGDDYGGWKADGPAFGDGPARGTLPGQMAVTGYLGRGLVNSFNGGDDATGTLTSPPFKIDRPFVDFLIERLNFDADHMQTLCQVQQQALEAKAAGKVALAQLEKATRRVVVPVVDVEEEVVPVGR